MFRPFYYFIGRRYLHVKRKNSFISFISMTSMLGIALGVTALIVVLSVMNGFGTEIRKSMLSGTPHITVNQSGGGLSDWMDIQQTLMHRSDVLGATPFVFGQGMLLNGSETQGVLVRGIAPEQVDLVYPLSDSMIWGAPSDLLPKKYGILVGKVLASRLNIRVGDKLNLYIPDTRVSMAGIMPRMRQCTVVGVFDVNYQQNAAQIIMHIKDAQRLFRQGENVSGLHVKAPSDLEAIQVASQLSIELPQYEVRDWTRQHDDFFDAIKMEKTVMTVILFLIVMVAVFNLVSSLVMLVADKRSDIAILRTMGATRVHVMKIFMLQGVLIGCVGSVIGLLLGIVLASNVTAIVDWIERALNVQLISDQVYFVGFVPSEIHASEVIWVCAISIFLSFLSTLYPAWRATRIQPAEALRYE